MVDRLTKRWIKDASDEYAVSLGARFDESRAEHFCRLVESDFRLYEGECAGQLVRLMTWQQDLFYRLFGWVKYSEDWGREVRRFRKASIWIPKKNGKSPSAAMVGLYLLAFDGEQGQKVYSAAKDGKQAGIVHGHAKQMVLQSDTLMQDCKINKTTGQILHLPTNSTYAILAGDNIQGQEGLNGSVIIDETHVVDARLVSVLEHMGASRSEPLQFEVSTAGNNPEGYGKRQQDYGRLVASGEVKDDEFLFICYEAPQNATDEQCLDPAIWQKANPSWGETIKPGEFQTACSRARQKGIAEWTAFKTYRLNIWSSSESPWLNKGDWVKCKFDFSYDSLRGRECWLGMDLSRTRDMSAVVAAFPDGDNVLLLPFFWLPQEVAEENNHKASYLQWAADGLIELTPGNWIDYRFIERRIIEIANDFRVQELVYDPKFADELTARLEDDHGIERRVFKQSMDEYTAPTDEFEKLVLSHRLKHNGNDVLSWQAGHVNIKIDDVTKKRRPVKPKHSEHQKIDGIVASIMALSGVMFGEEVASIYDREGRGFLELG